MGIKDALKRILGKSEKYKNADEDMNIQRHLENKQKNSDEREIEDWMEKRRKEKMREQVAAIHKMEQRNFWSERIFKNDNVFANHKSVLTNDNLLNQNLEWF